jgi:uncharacterized lipoprotein YbaY/heat shock protein HslJ
MMLNWWPLLNGAHAIALLLFLLPILASTSASAQTPAPTTSPNLGGTSWQLVKFQGGDDRTLMPDDKTKYTLQFTADGRVAARVDCNRGSATWKASGNQLQFGPLALTRAACLSPVLHDRIVKDWEYVRSYIVKDGHLFLSLMADAGIYEFAHMAAAKQGASAAPLIQGTATYRERMALPPTAVFEATLEDVSRADAAADVIARTRVASPGNPPIRFEITYDPARIQTNRSYVVRAGILDGERLMFTTDTAHPVLTRGQGNSVSLMMRRTSGTGATTRPPAGGGTSSQGAAAPRIDISSRDCGSPISRDTHPKDGVPLLRSLDIYPALMRADYLPCDIQSEPKAVVMASADAAAERIEQSWQKIRWNSPGV